MTQSLDEILDTLEAAARHRSERKIDFFEPYEKQKQFLALGKIKRERLFMAGNQLGKSECGAFETACHLTGEYPDWWTGKRFDHPVKGWAIGETGLLTRNVSQKKLCGEPGIVSAWGTGLIPKAALLDKSLARGVTDAYDTIQVQHKTNGVPDGISILSFKSYEQGRQKLQGDTLHFIWADEEPPEDIYSELLARLTGQGIIYITFTPLLGRSAVVLRFLEEKSPDREVVTLGIAEVGHFTEAEKKIRLDGYPAHERDARAKGTPMLGSGKIFDCEETLYTEPTLREVPFHWTKLWGIDFGIGHPFAAVLTLWDRDADIFHVHHAIRMVSESNLSLPIHHAAAMKPIGAAVPVAWPQDGTQRQEHSGEPLAAMYKKEGLRMLPTHATHPDGSVSTEAAIAQIDQAMKLGKFKVAAHLTEWFEEARFYHRKDGLIVRVRDDLMAATQKAWMAKRDGKVVQLGGKYNKEEHVATMARDIDFDLFA